MILNFLDVLNNNPWIKSGMNKNSEQVPSQVISRDQFEKIYRGF